MTKTASLDSVDQHSHVTDKLLFKRPQPTLSSAHTHPSHTHIHTHASVTHRGNAQIHTLQGELLRRPHTYRHTDFHICLLSLPPSLNFYLLHSLKAIPAYNLSPRWRAGTSPQGGKKCVCECVSVYTKQKWEMRLTARVTIMAPDAKVVGQEKVASHIVIFKYCFFYSS